MVGCTVQPLHSTGDEAASASADISINPVDTRLEQQVRNRLIFLLNGGGENPVQSRFAASLSVKSQSTNLFKVGIDDSDTDTTATRLTITGTLILTDTSNEDATKTFVRVAHASYDRTSQFFANSRAQINAEDRAAAVLAEELRNLVLVYVKAQ